MVIEEYYLSLKLRYDIYMDYFVNLIRLIVIDDYRKYYFKKNYFVIDC